MISGADMVFLTVVPESHRSVTSFAAVTMHSASRYVADFTTLIAGASAAEARSKKQDRKRTPAARNGRDQRRHGDDHPAGLAWPGHFRPQYAGLGARPLPGGARAPQRRGSGGAPGACAVAVRFGRGLRRGGAAPLRGRPRIPAPDRGQRAAAAGGERPEPRLPSPR